VTGAGTSGRQILIEWANAEAAWVRAIAGEVLATRKPIPVEAVPGIVEIFLAEKGLSDAAAQPVPALSLEGSEEAAAEPLRLVGLKDCINVNALAPKQEILFNSRLTVLFGENASGKTGYVRVLKRVGAVRSAGVVLPDVRHPVRSARPEALLSYMLGEALGEFTWRDETGVAPFTRMAVFDSPAVALHLDEDLTYLFTPGDLALFRHVTVAIEAVRSALDERVTAIRPRVNPFRGVVSRDSSLFAKLETLGESTDLPELELLGVLTEAERAEIESLKSRVDALSGSGQQAQAEMLRTRRALIERIVGLGQLLVSYDWDGLAAAVATLRGALDRQSAGLVAAPPIGGPPDAVIPAWQEFVRAGEHLLQAAGADNYPQSSDSCIYCGQDLAEHAVEVVRRYRDYASGVAAGEVAAAKAAAEMVGRSLQDADVVPISAGLDAVVEASADSARPAWLGQAQVLIREITDARRISAVGDVVDGSAMVALGNATLDPAGAALIEVSTTLEAVEASATERQQQLHDDRIRLAELEARAKLAELLPRIREHVGAARWANRLSTLLQTFRGTLRSLTEAAKTASEQALNHDFEQRFQEECTSLQAPAVRLDFPGRGGQPIRRKTVAPSHTLDEVLSEGEQKVIALADFLAEASLRAGSAPIVFDDPVNSLDYKRLQYVVDRIERLTAAHQVIVFTHNIWFTSELLARFDAKRTECTYYNVSESETVKGFVTPGSNPRTDSLRETAKKTQGLIKEAEGVAGEVQGALIEKAYEYVRNWCEIFVEQELLAAVTERYSPHVGMTKLTNINIDRFAAARDAILPIFDRACRYMGGHSQPLETLNVRPSLEDLQKDWASLQTARTAYAGR